MSKLGNHTAVITLSILASMIAVVVFTTGKNSLPEFFSSKKKAKEPDTVGVKNPFLVLDTISQKKISEDDFTDPKFSSYENNWYRNSYFNFSLPIPAGWDLKEMEPGLSRKPGYSILLYLLKSHHKSVADVNTVAGMYIAAEDVSAFPDCDKGSYYLGSQKIQMAKDTAFANNAKVSKSYDFKKVSGKDFYYMDIINPGNIMRLYATVIGTNVITISCIGATEEDLLEATALLDGIVFIK